MPSQDDNPDHSNAVSPAELNPLLNPILSKNMGRWAEVYFNSPPEKREEAVLKLVRELEQNPAPERPGRGGPMDTQAAAQPQRQPGNVAPAENNETLETICPSCGWKNRQQHKFCGRCGGRLEGAGADLNSEAGADLAGTRPTSQAHSFLGRQQGGADDYLRTGTFRETSPGENIPIFSVEPTSTWQTYRPYVAFVVALVVMGLAYVAWRGGLTTEGNSAPLSAPPVATSSPTPAATPANPSPGADTPTAPAAVAANPPVERSNSAAASNPTAANPPAPTSIATAKDHPAQVNPSPATRPATPAADNRATDVSLGGWQELAVAREFLNGGNGRQPNRSQAVTWLWKAVGKQNIDATVLLSGLYLRGDGVPKNCEQARLLLDAAALKGRKDAAEQLRNLRAFGCE